MRHLNLLPVQLDDSSFDLYFDFRQVAQAIYPADHCSEPTASPAPVASAVPSPRKCRADRSYEHRHPFQIQMSCIRMISQIPPPAGQKISLIIISLAIMNPEYYHIEITSPNSKTTVFEPQKQTFDNVTIELNVLTVSAKTAADGRFSLWSGFPSFGRSILCLYDFSAHQEMVCAQELAQCPNRAGGRHRWQSQRAGYR